MIIDVLASGSKSNCYLLSDREENQLLIECGLKYENITPHINFSKLDCLLLTHYH